MRKSKKKKGKEKKSREIDLGNSSYDSRDEFLSAARSVLENASPQTEEFLLRQVRELGGKLFRTDSFEFLMSVLGRWAAELSASPRFAGWYRIETWSDGRRYFSILLRHEIMNVSRTFIAYPTDKDWIYWGV